MSTTAIYNKGKYGSAIYGKVISETVYPNNYFDGIPVGLEVRGQIGKQDIFRIRRGNGYSGSTVGKKYQDKYDYFVPSSIMNTEGETSRQAFAAAVLNWHNLSDAEKTKYNATATRRGGLTGLIYSFKII